MVARECLQCGAIVDGRNFGELPAACGLGQSQGLGTSGPETCPWARRKEVGEGTEGRAFSAWRSVASHMVEFRGSPEVLWAH